MDDRDEVRPAPPAGEASEEERCEAEALARALEAGPARWAPAPQDALAAAALLRHAHAGGLEPARAEALLERLRGELAARRASPRAPRWRRRAAVGALPLVAAAAAALLHWAPAGAPAAALPAPGGALLRAQAGAATPGGPLVRLEREMADYRGAMRGALAARYGGPR